jgi:dTDP-4-amino-4,6-dideoxygalactose transaminase
VSGAGTVIDFLDLGQLHADLAERLETAWRSVLVSGRFVGGPEVEAFEAEFAHYCEAAGCVGVANGTDALELVLSALGIGQNDEVIVPANTFVATAEAVCAVGARPQFVDVRPDTLLLDPAAAEAAVGPRTAAVVAVHLYGQMCDMSALSGLADRHGLALVEDAAQAHGARFAGRRAGSVGVAATFSFYPSKNLGALGDGGAVVSDDAELLDRVRRLSDHGRSPVRRHRHEVAGRNSRLDSLQAALLRVKLSGLDTANAARRTLDRRYRAGLPAWCDPVILHPAAEAVHHLAVVQVPDREAATAALDRAGIGWGVHYPLPCHQQPAFANLDPVAGRLPVTENAAEHVLSLPMWPTLDPRVVDRVCDVLREIG